MEGLSDLRAARKSTGKSQQELEALSGIAQGDISKFESGAKLMSETVAQKLARHLPGTSPTGLLMSNKAHAFKKAHDRGDRIGVLKAAESIVKHAERLPEDPQLEAMLDRLVEKACRFAEHGGGEYISADNRDILGRRVDKSAGPDLRRNESYIPLAPEHQGPAIFTEDLEDQADELYGDADDGRDIHGFRIRPMSEEDGD